MTTCRKDAGEWVCAATGTETGKLERSFWGSLAARYPVVVLDSCKPRAATNQHAEAVPTSLTVSALFPQTGRAAHMKTAAFTEKHQPNQYRSTKDISVWHLAPFWQGSDVFPVPAPLWSPAEPSLPYQAARWFWRRRTTNTLLPSAGQHRETLLDLKTKSLFSLTARGFPLCSIWTLHICDRQQRGKIRGHFYGCSFSFPPCCWSGKRKGIQGCTGG